MEAPEYKPKLDLSQLTEEEIEQLKAAQKEEDDPDHPSSGNIPRHRHWPQMRFKKGKNIEFETPENIMIKTKDFDYIEDFFINDECFILIG